MAEWNQWWQDNARFGVDLAGARLKGADLNGAWLIGANLWQADLREADLREANLSATNLSRADLRGANLRAAELTETNLTQANLSSADFSGAETNWTIFANVDLSAVKGLATIRHLGPSTIGVDTLYKSGSSIPHEFLRGAGIPQDFLDYLPPSLRGAAIQFYSCFIS